MAAARMDILQGQTMTGYWIALATVSEANRQSGTCVPALVIFKGEYMSVDFSKFSSAGNDFVIMLEAQLKIPLEISRAEIARRLCDRRAGIGADGLILLGRANPMDALNVTHLNPDGSEATACINGLRAVGRYVATKFNQDIVNARTPSGVYSIRRSTVNAWTVVFPDMIAPPRSLNLAVASGFMVESGTEHFVVPVPSVADVDVEGLGARIASDVAFMPGRTNVTFIEQTSDGAKARIFERGVEKETMSCGSGAVAAAEVLRKRRTDKEPWQTSIHMIGGVLDYACEGGIPSLSGPCQATFTGQIEVFLDE